MSFNLTNLVDYTNTNSSDLIAQILYIDGTLNEVTIIPGVKGPTNINLFDTDAVLQAGISCAWNPSGTTTLSTRTITPAMHKVQESLCSKDLTAKYQVENLSPGSNSTDIPFEELYIDTKIKKINQGISNLAWNGNSTAGDLVDGWIVQIENDSDVNTITGASFSSGTIIAEIDSMIAGIDTNIMGADGIKIYLNYANYNTLYNALRSANNFHFDVIAANSEYRFNYPSALAVQIVAVRDMVADKAILTPVANLTRSVDLLSDEDEVFMTIDDRTRTADFQSFFTIGFNHAYGSQIVLLTA